MLSVLRALCLCSLHRRNLRTEGYLVNESEDIGVRYFLQSLESWRDIKLPFGCEVGLIVVAFVTFGADVVVAGATGGRKFGPFGIGAAVVGSSVTGVVGSSVTTVVGLSVSTVVGLSVATVVVA